MCKRQISIRMWSPSSLLFVLSLTVLAGDAEGFGHHPNCTLPPDGTHYVSGPNTRGTLTILWDFLSIFILFTWSILHLNVPASRRQARSSRQKLWLSILDMGNRIKWMTFTALMPEFILAKAMIEKMSANDSAAKIKEISGDSRVAGEWTRTHSYYANMGGFVIDFSDVIEGFQTQPKSHVEGPAVLPEVQPPSPPVALSKWESLQATIDNLSKTDSERINSLRMKCKVWALNADQLMYCLAEELINIDTIPGISEVQLQNLAADDAVVKFLAWLQGVYALFEFIIRKALALPVSPLETASVTFAFFGIVTYMYYYWDHPRGVRTVTVVQATRVPTEYEALKILRHGPSYIWVKARIPARKDAVLDLFPMPNDAMVPFWVPSSSSTGAYKFKVDRLLAFAYVFLLGATTIGGGYFIASWNSFVFPTPVEKVLWKTSSVLAVLLACLLLPLISYWMRPRIRTPGRTVLAIALSYGIFIPYILIRLFLIAEMLRTLFFLSPRSFVSTWSSSIPHLG